MVCYISSKWRFFSENAHRRVRILLFWIPIISLFIAIIIIIHINQSLLQDAFKLGLILLAFHVFFYSVLIFNSALAKKANILRLTKGEMRRSIAIILTIAYISVLFLDLANIFDASGKYTLYFAYGVYGAIIAFYFGLRTAEKMKIESMINKKDATKILEMRYALGDLSDGEFRKMQEELGLKEGNYLFSWDNIQGKDIIKVLKFPKDNLPNESVEIEKSNDKTIEIHIDGKAAKIVMDGKEEKATLTTDDTTCNLKVKSENGKLKIYEE
jgi:uncharacterized membrane protein